jgi:hypothetical protein
MKTYNKMQVATDEKFDKILEKLIVQGESLATINVAFDTYCELQKENGNGKNGQPN